MFENVESICTKNKLTKTKLTTRWSHEKGSPDFECSAVIAPAPLSRESMSDRDMVHVFSVTLLNVSEHTF